MRFFSTLTSLVLSLGAIVVQAQKQNGENAITFPLGGTVDGGAPIQITWNPSTSGTVSIVLLKGPPTNILDIETIAPGIANSGVFTWNVPTTLEDKASMQDGRKYAFKIVDDLTKDFEYSPPFEMTVPGSTFAVPSSSAEESSTTSAPRTSTISSTSTTREASTTTTEEATSTTEESTETSTTESETETETTTQSTKTPTSTPTAEPSTPSNSGLAKPAIIAIVVIIIVALVAVVIGVVLCAKRRKRASDRDSMIGDSLGPAHHARGDNIAIGSMPQKTVAGTPYGKQAPVYSGSTATLANPFEEPKSNYNVNNTSVASLQNPFAEPVARTRSREADYNSNAGYGYANSTPGYARSTNDTYTSDGYNPYGNKF